MQKLKGEPLKGFHRTKFEFYVFNFKVSTQNNKTTRDVLQDIVDYINKSRSVNKEGVFFTRYENDKSNQPRSLWINYAAHDLKEKKFKFCIGLNRKENPPWQQVPDTLELVPLKHSGNLWDLTYLFIDYSKHTPVACVQFKDSGARFLDIVFYLKQLAKHLNIATNVAYQLLTDKSIQETLDSAADVLSIKMIVKPDIADHLDMQDKHYFSGMKNLDNAFGPRKFEIKLRYQDRGKKTKTMGQQTGNKGLQFFKKMLFNFQSTPEQEQLFERFQVEFNDSMGEKLYFDLLYNKAGFEIDINFSQIKNTTDIFKLVAEHFNDYLNNEYTKG
jgi:hypothetical protein